MRKNGFTLIELLAVIVILAIIALIATPIILGIIKDAKEKSTIISTENYINAIELAIISKNLDENSINIDGNYVITNSGKQIKDGKKIININYDGSKFDDGTVEIKNQKVKSLYAKINNNYVSLTDQDFKIFKEKTIMVKGSLFNSRIKNLANKSTEMNTETEDNLIKKIEFLSFGILPENYTIEKLKQLKSADVSANKNKSIIAYYDKEAQTIFVYSENKIIFNSQASGMFTNFSSVETIEFGDHIDTSSVAEFYQMFTGCKALTTLDLSKWNTDGVTQMSGMFGECSSLKKLDLSSFSTINVTQMEYMFHYMENLEELNIGSFDTSNVESMNSMFSGCRKLETIDLSNFKTDKVTNMRKMFREADSFEMLDLSHFNITNLDNVIEMFADTNSLKEIKLPSNWDLNKFSLKDNVFLNCGKKTPTGQCKITIVNN